MSQSIFAELVQQSWERYQEACSHERIDDVLLGAVIASMVRDGYALIGLTSDGVNHHLRLEKLDQGTRLILRLTHLSEEMTVARVQGHLGSVVIGYGERTAHVGRVWGGFEQEAKSLYTPATEPGIISFDADPAAGYIYAQISLLLDLDRYIDGDFRVDLELFGSHLGAVVDSLRTYLRARLPEAPPEGGRSRSHQREIQQSRDEILIGEVVAVMGEAGYPVIGIASDVDYQRIRFQALEDPTLHSVTVALDRGGERLLFRSARDRATLRLQAEVKNYLADTEQLLRLYLEDLKSLAPDGDVQLGYRLNSVFAWRDLEVSLEGLPGAPGREELGRVLMEAVAGLRERLLPYKRG